MLSFPLFLDPNQADSEQKQQKIQRIMLAVNVCFYLQLAIWAGFMFAYSDYEDKARWHKVYSFSSVNKFLSIILLITSTLLFRRKFNHKKAQKVFAREKKIVLI